MAAQSKQNILRDAIFQREWLLIGAIVAAHLGLYWIAALPFLPLLISAVGLSALTFVLQVSKSRRIFSAAKQDEDEGSAAHVNEVAGAVLLQFPDPLIVLDGDGRVVLSNADIHQSIANAAPGRILSAVMRTPAVLDAVARIYDGGEAETVEFETPGATESHSHAHCLPMQIGKGDDLRLFVLIILHDLTAARRVDQMRVDFIANVSHELKTPLTSLAGFIETLQGPARDDEEAREKFLEIMQKQSTRMGRLVDDLLSLSRIELDEHVPPSDTVQTNEVITEVISNVRPVAEERKVSIAFHTEEDLPNMLASRDQMFQVFQNLIMNAVKYGGSNNRVEVSVYLEHKVQDESDEEAIRVDVTDHGPGIAREHIPRLTERFYRVDENQSRTSGGTGLGLAIVKHIVARHRGEFSIQSTLGKGSTFSVVIPVFSAESSD